MKSRRVSACRLSCFLAYGIFVLVLMEIIALLAACGSAKERRMAGKRCSYMDYAVALHELGLVVGSAVLKETPEQTQMLQDLAAVKAYCKSPAGCYYDPLWDDLCFVTGYHPDDPRGCILAFPASSTNSDSPALLLPTSINSMRSLAAKFGVTQQELRKKPWLPVKDRVSEEVLENLKSRLRVLHPGERAESTNTVTTNEKRGIGSVPEDKTLRKTGLQ